MADSVSRPARADDSGHGGLQILLSAGPTRFVGDEPVEKGGLDLGPTPHDLVAAGLVACVTQTLRLYATRKAWPLGAVHVEARFEAPADPGGKERLAVSVALGGDLDDEQRARLMEIADRCPIHRLLVAGAEVTTSAIAPTGA